MNKDGNDERGFPESNEIYRTGFSCLGLLISIIVGLLLLVANWLDDLRAMPNRMPLVGTCSAAISAACHARHKHPEKMVLRPLKWGAVESDGDVLHCTFSDDIDAVAPLHDGDVVARTCVTFSPDEWRGDDTLGRSSSTEGALMATKLKGDI